MGLLSNILLSICTANLIFLVFFWVKNEVTFKNREKILDAIYDYCEDTCDFGHVILMIDNMESYDETLWRLRDFGCENILPRDDYKLIKPYIREK